MNLEDQSYDPGKGQADILVTKAIRNVLVRGAPASLRSSVVVFFCRHRLMVGKVIMQQNSLIAMKMMGSQNNKRPGCRT